MYLRTVWWCTSGFKWQLESRMFSPLSVINNLVSSVVTSEFTSVTFLHFSFFVSVIWQKDKKRRNMHSWFSIVSAAETPQSPGREDFMVNPIATAQQHVPQIHIRTCVNQSRLNWPLNLLFPGAEKVWFIYKRLSRGNFPLQWHTRLLQWNEPTKTSLYVCFAIEYVASERVFQFNLWGWPCENNILSWTSPTSTWIIHLQSEGSLTS